MPSKYSSGDHRREVNKPTGPHPVWNAIGCITIIVTAVMSIAGAMLTVQIGLSSHWPIPTPLLTPIVLPDWIYAAPGLAAILKNIVSVKYLLAYIIFSVIYMVILGGIASVGYSFIHRVAGPPRYGPLDAEPIKSKRYKPQR